MAQLDASEIARMRHPSADPAPDFMKHLTDEQQKAVMARHLDAQIAAMQGHIETLKTARDMMKVVVVKK